MSISSIKMICYDRIDLSEGIDVNRTSALKECDVCHYWYFLNYSFKFQLNVRNRCHNSLMMYINLSDIGILSLKCSDYRCIISLISKNDAIWIWMEKVEHYKFKKWFFLRSIYKNGENNYKIL